MYFTQTTKSFFNEVCKISSIDCKGLLTLTRKLLHENQFMLNSIGKQENTTYIYSCCSTNF